ncbi:hypothetical protein D8674_008928 [Pyrus ussuriensis x Pyrus communis]|uniref:Uncharacterized protein n=1 Tax=Pyrus ussuriensis x Pyrus communis TaxID=2448454 RepID=A0A5N5HUT6_9ROSA|nr:hypothetical protein D8674_008928 [Pyrus ussuriensis x Pyrus communis]
MDARSMSRAHFLSPSRHAGIPLRPSVQWFRPNCGFVSFLLRCLGQIDHLVAFSSFGALVVTGKTFVIPTAAAHLLIGLGFMYLIPPTCFGLLLLSVCIGVTFST